MMSRFLSLTPSESACLDALRSGTNRKMFIATQVGSNLVVTQRSLERLASSGLAISDGRGVWRLTKQGKSVNVAVALPSQRRGRSGNGELIPTGCPARMLALLDRPRHITELPQLLDVTRQRIHQAVLILWTRGLIRSIGSTHPSFVIARKGDPSTLLTGNQERLLSVFQEATPTTISKAALAAKMSVSNARECGEHLQEQGLIETVGKSGASDLCKLTLAGIAHWQRNPAARRAEPPPPPLRSERIFLVLSHLERHGPTRTRDIASALGTPQPSTNALMQYLKRKEIARPKSTDHIAPYELTTDGRATLAAMKGSRTGQRCV
jgi:predicted transcriptional regulator